LIAMAAVPQPHRVWKHMLMEGEINPAQLRASSEILGAIHRRSYSKSKQITVVFQDRSYFETLRLGPFYHQSAKNVPEAVAFINQLISETRERQLCLVHGDFSPKNLLIIQGGIVLLDHEVVHFGDPAFDVGFFLAHFLSKAHHLPAHQAKFLAAVRQFIEMYIASLSASPLRNAIEEPSVKHTLACMLARAVGKSPLEYLTDSERNTQREIVVALMKQPPNSIDDLVDRFASRL